VHLDPSSIEDHLLLGRLYRLNNETAKRKASSAPPSSCSLVRRCVTTLALLYNEEGDPGRALEILQSVPEASARRESIRCSLHLRTEEGLHQGHRRLPQGSRTRRDNLDAVRGLAQNLLNDNQTDAALEQFKTIATADPQDVQTLLHISEITAATDSLRRRWIRWTKRRRLPRIRWRSSTTGRHRGSARKVRRAVRQLREMLQRTEKQWRVLARRTQ